MTHIIDIVKNINGNSTVGLDTETVVDLKGGKKNPQKGRVTKVTTGLRVMAFQNKNVNGYEAMVKRRLVKEGKSPSSFVLGSRRWGTRLENMPIVEHKGNYYLEVILLTPGKVEYRLDGNPIAEADIEGMPPQREKSGQGGLDDQVIICTYKVASLQAVRIDKQEYTDIEG